MCGRPAPARTYGMRALSWIHDKKREKSKSRTVGNCPSHKAAKKTKHCRVSLEVLMVQNKTRRRKS